MAAVPLRSTVAVFNTSPDVIDLLRSVLERAGFGVASAFTFELRDSKIDLDAFIREHDPKVIVYDIAPPYEDNWHLFQRIHGLDIVRSIAFVLTTTNAAQVRRIAGARQDLHEIVGKPLDLDEIVGAVVEAAHARLEPPPVAELTAEDAEFDMLRHTADLRIEHEHLQRETAELQREHAYLQAHPKNIEAHREHLRKLHIHDQALAAHTEKLKGHQGAIPVPEPRKDDE